MPKVGPILIRFSIASWLLLAAAANVRAQAPAPPPGPAAAPALAPSPERWYKIELQSRHLGHARTTVTPFQEKDRALMRIVEEVSWKDPVSGFPAGAREDAVLLASDLTLVSYRFSTEMNLPVGRVALEVTCESQGKGQWSAVYTGPRGKLSVPLASEEPVTASGAIPLLIARNRALTKEGGVVRYHVLSPLQADRMILDVEVTVRRPEMRTYLEKETSVTPYSWHAPYLAAEEEMTITEYMTEDGEVMESTQTLGGSGLSLTYTRVATEEKALPEGRRVLQRRGRRDPFDRNKVLTARGEKTDTVTQKGDGGGPKSSLTPAEILGKFNDARKLVKDAETLGKQTPSDRIKEQIRQKYNEFLDRKFDLARQRDLNDAQKNELENLCTRMEAVFPGAQGVIEEAQKLTDKAQVEFDKGNFPGVHEIVEAIKALKDRKELAGMVEKLKQFEDKALRLAQRLEARIKTREEFQKIKLDITGIIYHLVETPYPVGLGVRVLGQDLRVADTVRIPISHSGAIINGYAAAEGDVLDPKSGEPKADLKSEDGLLVTRIRPDEVVFRFKEEEIPVPLK